MRRIRVFLLIPLFFITLCLDRSYAADNKDLVIEFIYEYAKNLYKKGDIEGAKQEFNKVLLIAPDNQAAIDFLKKLGEDPVTEDPQPELLSQEYLSSFKEDMNFLINKVAILEGKNRELATAIKALEDNNQLLRSNLNQVKSAPKEKLTKADFSPKISDMQYQLRLMENNLQKKETEIRDLKSQVTKLTAESGNLNERNSLIKNLETQIIKLKTIAEQRQAEYENKLKTTGDVFLAKNQELSRQNALIILEKEQVFKDLKSQAETLRVSLVNKDNEIKQLDIKVQQAVKNSDDFAGKIESLNKESREKDGRFKESAMKIAEYESQIKALSGLQSQLKSAQDSLANKDNLILAKDKQIQSISLNLNDQEKQVDTNVKLIQRYASQVESLNKESRDKDGRLKAMENSTNEIKSFTKTKIKSLQARLDQAKKESEQKINDYQAKINESNKSLEQVKSDKDKGITNKDKEITKLQEQISADAKQIEKINSAYASQVESLTKESRDKDGQLKESAMKIADYESQIKSLSDLQSQLRSAQDSLANKDNLILAKDKQIQDISLNLKDQEKQVDANVKQMAKLTSDYSQQTELLKNEINNKDALLKDIRTRLDQAKKESEQKINDYQAKINESNKSLEQVKSDKDKGITNKDKEITKLQEQISADAKQIEKINSAYASQVESLTKESQKKDSQLKESAQKIIDLKDSQVLLEQTKKESSQKAASYETKIKELEKSLTNLQTQVYDDAKIIKKLNTYSVARSDSFKSEVSANDVKVRDLEARLAKQVSENEDYIKSLREKIAESQMDLETLKKESGSLAAIQDNTQLETAKWTAELKDTKDKMQKDLQQEINDYKIKLDLSKQGIVVSVLSDVLFDSGSDVIKPESMKMLNKIADALSHTVKDNQIIIEGHTDNDPIKHSGWKSNWELSSIRAISVLNYFTRDRGLEADRFVVNAYGEFKPVANNDTKEGKSKNRRVEIIILPFKIIKVKADKQ